MTAHAREGSRDRELVLSRHQTVPMWDSSDPERAPPPLPLNPGSTSPITRSNVSPGIQAVAANFTEKLRETAPSQYTTNPMPPKSPEKSLIKGQFHKRMQSLQNTDTRSEFLNYLENRSPERPLRASILDQSLKQPEKVAARPETPPGQQSSDRDLPNLLISNRYLSRPLFGESTPPSATMLALQNMQLPPENEPQAIEKEPESFPEAKPSHSSGFESLSDQILSLTDIASGLQREMAQLSRRSKDNATDLISLKAATNARDEDIRKSLRDLSSNLATKFLDADGTTRWDISALLGSENAINQTESDSSPNSKRSYSAPRMQSPSPFIAAMERELSASPGPITDGSASIALLEKVLREMATKEGQEKLLELVNELKARPNSSDSNKNVDYTMTKMLEEILNIVKQDSGNKALVRSRTAAPSADFSTTSARSVDPEHVFAPDMDVIHGGQLRSVERSAPQKDNRSTDELLDIMKRVRSSVIEGGGMTNEVKALVRELRGEVLGMGRNLARKLEDVEHTRAIEDVPKAPGVEEIAHIVDRSLHELRAQLHSILNDNRRHSSALAEFRAAMDSAEIYSIVNKALDHFGMTHLHKEPDGARMQKEDILEAVREAWETYKPEIELQNFGLERDEILECLTEGLKAYQPQHEQAATYDQVLAAVQDGIQLFEVPPTITRDEIVQTIQGCLESSQPRSFDDGQLAAIRDEVLHAVTESMASQSSLTSNSFDSGLGRDDILSAVSDGIQAHMLAAKGLEQPSPSVTRDDITNAVNDAFVSQQSALTTNLEPTISREEIINAIAEGLESQNSIPREIELNKEDLMEAITAGLNEVTTNATQDLGEQILQRLQQQLDGVREELGQRPSGDEADTEQILNTIKDSIAVVRQDVEGYAANASEASGKYEILDTVKEGFRLLQADLEKTITETSLANQSGGNPDTPELLDAMEREFEHLRQTLSSLLIHSNSPSEKGDILDAIRDLSENHKPSSDENISQIIKQEFDALRDTLTMSIVPAERGEPKSGRDDIIAAVQAALEVFHEERSQLDSENNKSISDENISQIIKQEFDALRDTLTMSIVPAERGEPKSDRDDIIAAVQAALEVFHEERSQLDSENNRSISDENISQIIKQELEGLRDSLATSAEPKIDKDDIITTVQAALEVFYEERSKANPEPHQLSSDENFSQIKQELEGLRDSLATSVVPADPKIDKDEIIATIQATLEAFHEERSKANSDSHELSHDEHFSQIKQELEGLRETLTTSIVPAEPKIDKDDIITAIEATLAFHEARSKADSEIHQSSSDENISQIKQELESLRETLTTSVVPAEPKIDKDDIITAIEATLAFHEARSKADSEIHQSSSDENISQIKQELESLRETLTTSVVLAEPKIDKDDIITAIEATLAFHEARSKADSEIHQSSSDENISQIKQELESLRETLTTSVVLAEPKIEKDDIIAAIQATLEAFHEERGQVRDIGESQPSTTEFTDVFHDGVGIIREDLAKLLERRTEFDPSELLDALREGLAGLKAEVEMLRQSQADSEESGSSRGRELMLANESTMTSDIEGLKALISQLQVKVDAIEAVPRAADLPGDIMKKEHMDEVLLGLHELQSSVAGIVARDSPVDGTTAKKEDTDAIETLLRTTKSQLDEMVFPAADEIARAEQLGSLEEIVKETKDVVTELYGRMEAECPTKADIGTLETLMKDMWIALDESKGKDNPEESETESEKLVKADLQTVEAMIFDVRTQVEELKLPDVETLPTKSEIEGLAAMMAEFKEKVEADQELTGQGFEARKIEHAGLAEKMDEARAIVEGLGEELKSKLDGSHEGLSELKQLLEGLSASAESFTTVENVNELTELINREFERARGEQDATKLETEERDSAALVKHDETKATIIVELGAKIDEKLDEVMAKYDEAQSLTDSKFSEAAQRDTENLEAVTNTRALAEDIKLVIGSMGDSVNEACERMNADAKTFLEKVDVSYNKMEDMHNEVKVQQEQSRSDVERAAAATERVETKLHEFHPQVLESIQEILAIVGQHYNHSQQTAQDLKMDLSVLPTTIPQMFPALPPPEPEKYDDGPVHEKLNNILEHTKGNQVQEALNVLIERVTSDQVHEKLDQLLSHTTSTNGQVYEKLSELLGQAASSQGPIHDKLDSLIDHATNTDQSVTQMMKLDEMHKDIMETSRKMNEMLVSQSTLVAEDNERRRKEAEEAAVALERRTAQKEQVEADIVNLNDEKDSLLGMIQRLKSEKDELATQNAKLNKEVSALEMALELRHEEMQVMEDRADSLEKRILEGVLDHARTVLLNRPNSVQGWSMKKVRNARARNASASSTASTAKDARSILGSSVGLALKKRAPPASQSASTTAPTAGKERRILSLSHVTGNRGIADRQSGTTSGLANLKRSQSVKSNFSSRKASWASRSSVANKENEVFAEEEEHQSGDESDTCTERRTSYTGTYTDSMTYGPGSIVSIDRQVSGASTATGAVPQSIVDDAGKGEERRTEEKDVNEGVDGEDDTQEPKVNEPEDHTQQLEEHLNEESSKMVLYAPPSDSGLGTEIASTAG